jgi:hypothetical protein
MYCLSFHTSLGETELNSTGATSLVLSLPLTKSLRGSLKGSSFFEISSIYFQALSVGIFLGLKFLEVIHFLGVTDFHFASIAMDASGKGSVLIGVFLVLLIIPLILALSLFKVLFYTSIVLFLLRK